jgi:membrane protease YdiL (CAAX protease family)
LAAALFGAIHIPQAVVLLEPSRLVVAYALLGNGVPGIVLGWLYWRRGLVAAMVCHFAADFLLKAVLPLLGIA